MAGRHPLHSFEESQSDLFSTKTGPECSLLQRQEAYMRNHDFVSDGFLALIVTALVLLFSGWLFLAFLVHLIYAK